MWSTLVPRPGDYSASAPSRSGSFAGDKARNDLPVGAQSGPVTVPLGRMTVPVDSLLLDTLAGIGARECRAEVGAITRVVEAAVSVGRISGIRLGAVAQREASALSRGPSPAAAGVPVDRAVVVREEVAEEGPLLETE